VPYKLLSKNLHDTAWYVGLLSLTLLMLTLLSFHAGVASLIPSLATSQAHIDNAAFEDAIQEYQCEEKDAAVENEVKEYEYPSSEGEELIDDE
jgi:hypothetical protein